MEALRRRRRVGLARRDRAGRGDPRPGGRRPASRRPAGPGLRAGRGAVPEHPHAVERREVRGDRGRPGGDPRHDRRPPQRPRLARPASSPRSASSTARPTGSRAIDAIADRTDPGPGGFYDDLGDPAAPARTSSAAPASPTTPTSAARPYVGFDDRPGWPLAWCRERPEPLRRPAARCITTASTRRPATGSASSTRGDNFRVADPARRRRRGDPPPDRRSPTRPARSSSTSPPPATADGTLTLRWTREPGRGGNGRGCQVAEVWLIRHEWTRSRADPWNFALPTRFCGSAL